MVSCFLELVLHYKVSVRQGGVAASGGCTCTARAELGTAHRPLAAVLLDGSAEARLLLQRPGPPQQLRVELPLEARQAVHRRAPRAQRHRNVQPLRGPKRISAMSR